MSPKLQHLSLSALVSLLPALLLVPFWPARLLADEVKLTPAISVAGQYSDNISLAGSRPSGDFLSTVTGSFSLSDRGERHDGSLTAGVTRLDYLHHEQESGIDYFALASGNYLASERLSFGAGAGVRRDNRLGSVDPRTGLATNSTVQHQNYSLAGKYAVSEALSAGLSYGFSRDNYQTPGYLDTTLHQAVGELRYDIRRWLPGTTQYTRVMLSRDDTDFSRVDGVTATVGLAADISERLRLSANAGGRGTWSRFPLLDAKGVPVATGTGGDSGWVGDLTANYSGAEFSATLALLHELTTASGRSGATQRTGVNLGISRRLTNKLTGSAQAAYSRNKARPDQFSQQGIDEVSRSLGCQLSYDLTEQLSLQASYSNTNIDYRLSATTANQNIYLVKLSWQNPFTR